MNPLMGIIANIAATPANMETPRSWYSEIMQSVIWKGALHSC